MPPTWTTDCWSSAIAARTATRKRIGCYWRRSFRGRPPSRRRRNSRRPSGLGDRRRHCSVSIAPPGALAFLDGKIASLPVPRIRHLSDRALASPWLYPSGTANATSFYDTCQLRDTLERFVDFDRLNAGAIRLSIGAVNVRSGNFVYFDTQTHTIGPEHIMASGALPPGFPPIEIEGEHYWDGGLVSNTPLQWIVESRPRLDTLAFQVDLWGARGELPRNLAEVSTRQKDIQYSSRTRAGTDSFKRIQRVRRAAADLLDKLPRDLRRSPEAAVLRNVGDRKVYNIVHLIYRAKNYEGPAKDYEFSRGSMEDHLRAGYYDVVRTLRHPGVVERPTNHEGVLTFDLAADGRE